MAGCTSSRLGSSISKPGGQGLGDWMRLATVGHFNVAKHVSILSPSPGHPALQCLGVNYYMA